MPEWQAGGLVEDYGHYNRGEAAILSTAEEVTGIKREISTYSLKITSERS
jgi:hypothetical protein